MLVVRLVSAPSEGCRYLGLVPSRGGELDGYATALIVPNQAFCWVVFDIGEVREVASVSSYLDKGWPTDALKQLKNIDGYTHLTLLGCHNSLRGMLIFS